MNLFKRIKKEYLYSIIFFALVLFICIYLFSAKFLEKTAFDAMLKLSANTKGNNSIVNVVIDDTSINEISQLPWARTLYADIFDFLKISNARLIVFDAILATQGDAFNDKEFIERIKELDNFIIGVNFSKNENLKNITDEKQFFENNFALKINDKRKNTDIEKTKYFAFQEMMPEYVQNVKYIGAVNSVLDNDGAIRAFEPIIYLNGKYYPSLPLAANLALKDYKEIVINNDSYEILYNNGTSQKFYIKKQKDKYVQYIKWLAPYDSDSWVPHEQIKASDVIKSYRQIQIGEKPIIDFHKFKDKIIVVGATANSLYDLKITPLTVNMPGSTIQATAIDNLITNNSFIIANDFINILLIVLFSLVISFIIFYFSPVVSLVSTLIVAFSYFYLALFFFTQGLAINIITPYIYFIITAILAYSYKFTLENYKKERLKRAMKKYINTNVVDDIIKNTDEDIKLGGKKAELTILMADIRGFTRISEKLEPDEVTNLLNEYFGIMLPIIEKYNGTINKFIGDAILAVFNEPIKDKKHPQKAILCADEMLKEMRKLKKKWKEEQKPDIGISIGINTGKAFIGNIGTPNHLEYTVIGDTVNVASRIEAQNRKFNTQILISDTTYEYVKDMVDVIKISSVEIRGREKHMDIYEVINII